MMAEQRRELRDRLIRLPEQRVRAAEFPARVAIVHTEAQLFAQLRDAAVVVARVEIRDFEISLRDLHLGVELERLRERRSRLLVQPLVVVEDAEIVVRARIGRIDAARERLQRVAITIGGEGRGHGAAAVQPTRIARSMVVRLARSGSMRKNPRSDSLSSFRWNSVSTQKTYSAPCATSRNVDVITASLMSIASVGGEGSRIMPMNSLSALRYAALKMLPASRIADC